MLEAWAGPLPTSALAKVPRGCSGPGSTSSDGPSGAPDVATLLLSIVVPMVTMMAQSVTSTMQKASHRQRSPPSSLPPSSPPPSSSPPYSSSPPPVQDELDIFLEAFGCAKEISEECIDMMSVGLKAGYYTPDAISEDSLPFERLKVLTGLPEGQVYALRKFARAWCGKVDAKRAKRSH